MSIRRCLVILLLAACAVLPGLIGASCPPPANPPIIGIVPQNTGTTSIPVPPCEQGFVCVNLANNASVPVQMALYLHNGYDPNDQFKLADNFACCTNPNSPVACICPCPGKDTGNCKLNRIQIFQQTNLSAVNGLQTTPLQTGQSVLRRIRCEDVKTLGASTAQATGDPINAPEDANGPLYRDEPGGVACGQTVQFLTTDLEQSGTSTGGATQATLIIRQAFSR